MAQWNKTTQDYLNQERSIHEVMMLADEYGHVISPGATATSAFGETLTVPVTPVVQHDAIYGIDPTKFETYTFGGGTAQSVDSQFEVTAGATANSYGVLRSRRFVRYRPGQGCVARFTAAFSSNPVGFTQRAGFFNQEQALQIGYDHTNAKFGILRANGGKADIHNFHFTALDNGDITLTVNGISFTAVTVAGGSIAANIAALVAGLKLQPLFNILYTVEYNSDDITLLATSLGPQTGTDTVTSTATVTFTSSHLQTGVAQTENWIYQENWNLDKLDGTGTSGVTLDPSKLNVYQINFRWLGAGEMRFAVENPLNGDMIFFHQEQYSNAYNTPHLDNPSMKIGYVAANLGNPGSGSVSVCGASMMGAIEGIVRQTTNTTAATGSRSDSMNSPNSVYHILSVKNRLCYRDKINTRDLIAKSISAGVTTTAAAPAVLYVYYHPTVPVNLQWKDTGAYNASYYATGQFIITNPPQPIAVFQFTSGSAINVDISQLFITLPPNAYLSIGVSSTSNMSAASAGLIFVED